MGIHGLRFFYIIHHYSHNRLKISSIYKKLLLISQNLLD